MEIFPKLNYSDVNKNKYLDEQSLDDTNNNNQVAINWMKQKVIYERTGKVLISCR